MYSKSFFIYFLFFIYSLSCNNVAFIYIYRERERERERERDGVKWDYFQFFLFDCVEENIIGWKVINKERENASIN